MIAVLFTAANAVFPMMLLLILGWVLRSSGFLTGSFISEGNKLVFHVFLPVSLFMNIYGMESLHIIPWNAMLYCMGVVLLIFSLSILVAKVTTPKAERRGVVLQGCIRSNVAILGLALAEALGGSDAMGTASILTALAVPLQNVLAVLSFMIFSDEKSCGEDRIRDTVVKIFRNPLIRGTVAGILFVAIRELQIKLFGEPVFTVKDNLKYVYTAMNQMKAVTTPLAMLLLGGQFILSAASHYRREIAVTVAVRILLAPVLAIGGAVLLTRAGILNFTPRDYPALIALFGSPTAVSSAIMANQMGADDQLATQIVVWSSLLSILTIFAISCVLISMGLITV